MTIVHGLGQHAAMALGHVGHELGFVGVGRQGLFAEHVFSASRAEMVHRACKLLGSGT